MRLAPLIISTLLLAPTLATRAEVRPVVAVFDIEPSGVELARAQRDRLSNYLADKIAEIGFFRVVPRSELKQRIGAEKADSYRACYDDACQIELGRELAAQKILSARISRIGNECKLSATIYDLARAATDISSIAGGSCDPAGLSRSIDRITADLSTRRTSALTPEERDRYLAEARAGIPEAGRGHASPYFFVLSSSPETDRLPLEKTSVRVDVAGAIAEVNVTQHYKNEGRSALEALYIFPASERAAISSMRMMIGERVIDAQIARSRAAREEYEEARDEGKTAALLEMVRPNVYQMNVAQILPGDQIKVELRYTELLVPDRGIYELVYPTLNEPRYAAASRPEGAQSFSENPFLAVRQSSAPLEVEVDIRAGTPVARVESPSHRLDIRYRGPREVHTSVVDRKSKSDFVLHWSLAGERIAAGLLLYPGEKENFFLMMMEPPQRTGAEEIVPREIIFIVDVSGSMSGFPIETSKKLMSDLLAQLRPSEYFNIVLFAGGSEVFSPRSLAATAENVSSGMQMVKRESGGGGTLLLPALERALMLPRKDGFSRTIVVLTDGEIDAVEGVLATVHENLSKANVFAFGIGRSVDRSVIEGIARAGMGEPFIVVQPAEAPETAKRFRSYISAPVLTGVHYRFEGFDAYDVEPQTLGDLFAERPLIAFGKYRGKPRGSIVIDGDTANARFSETVSIRNSVPSAENAALRDLWARHRIQRLADLQNSRGGTGFQAEIEALGLNYGQATPYTSFVAVDSEARGRPALASSGRPEVQVANASPRAGSVEESYAGGSRIKRLDLVTPSPVARLSRPDSPSRSGGGGFGLQLAFDPVAAQASIDGTTILSYGTVDVLLAYGEPGEHRFFGGLGLGYLAPRARAGFDLFLSDWSLLRLGTRASFARNVDQAFLFTLAAELGLGVWFEADDTFAVAIVASYLVGPGVPLGDLADRQGTQLLQGGSLSIGFEF